MSGEDPKEPAEDPQPGRKGFAVMSKDQRRAIARMGGQAAHASGAAHRFTSDEARSAGQKGGLAISADLAHMAEIGRRGGRLRKGYRRDSAQPRPAEPVQCAAERIEAERK